MARKKPTIKEIEAKVEVLTNLNNKICQTMDNLGNIVKYYIEMKGETIDFQKYYMEKVKEVRSKIQGGK
jgi:glutamine amidotransferase PdxT